MKSLYLICCRKILEDNVNNTMQAYELLTFELALVWIFVSPVKQKRAIGVTISGSSNSVDMPGLTIAWPSCDGSGSNIVWIILLKPDWNDPGECLFSHGSSRSAFRSRSRSRVFEMSISCKLALLVGAGDFHENVYHGPNFKSHIGILYSAVIKYP